MFHLKKRSLSESLVANPLGRALDQWWFVGWGFDWIYDKVFVEPFIWVANVNKSDFIDSFYRGIARLAEALYGWLSSTETGRVRWYATAMAAGSVLFVGMMLLR